MTGRRGVVGGTEPAPPHPKPSPWATDQAEKVREGLTAHVMVWREDPKREGIRTAVDNPDCNHCAAEAALDALVAELASLKDALGEIVPDVLILLDDHFSGCVEERVPAIKAAGRLIELLTEGDEGETNKPVAGLVIPGPALAERHAANRAAAARVSLGER